MGNSKLKAHPQYTSHRSQYNIPYLLVSEQMVGNVVRGCVNTMKFLKETGNESISDWHIPYYILANIALEGFAKIFLAKEFELGTPIPVIESSLRRMFRHDLSALYSEKGVGKKFLSAAGIKTVKKTDDRDKLIFRYDFDINYTESIYIYDIESIRYGLLTEDKANAGYVAYQIDAVFDLCSRVESAFMSLTSFDKESGI